MDCRVLGKSLKTVFSFAYACTFLYICFQNATIMKYPIGIQSFDQIIYTLFFIVGIYVICNFRSQDICFNYSIIDSGNYYKGVFKNILKLAVYVLEMLLISMAAVILLVIAADPGSAFIVSMILQIVIYYVCSLIEIGTIYLLLSFLERRSYKSDKYVSSATVISLCVTIFIYAVYTAAVIFIDSQPISQTNALMLISAVSIIKTYIKSAFLIFMTYFGYEYQKKRRNRLLSGACITVILSEIFYVFASQIANGLIYVYMPEIMDNDAYVINNILSNTKMLIDGLLKIGDAVGLALVIIALTKDKVIHRSNRLAVLAFVLFGGIEAFLFTQTDILRVKYTRDEILYSFRASGGGQRHPGHSNGRKIQSPPYFHRSPSPPGDRGRQ